MGKRLAIEHHLIRPNEVIELLEMMGGKNKDNADGCSFLYYTLCTPKINNPNNDKVICGFTNLKMQNDHFAIFTLEKFWKKYPYKVGDKVVYEDDNDIVVISEIMWDDTVGDIFYNVKRIDEDECFLCPPELLKPYKETNKELAIKGHPTRSKEIIELLEMMGGKNIHKYDVTRDDYVYVLSERGSILAIPHCNIHLFDCVIFTLDEFLEKYPFKAGDKVFLYDNITLGCVTGMKWDEETVKYCVYTSAECWCDVKELLKWNALDLVERHYGEQCEEMLKDITLKHLYELGMENIKDNFKLVPNKMDDKLEYEIIDGYEFDKVEIGKIILKPIKPKYPTTYVECKEMLDENVYYGFSVFMSLQNLIICRDVYWKIAGEKMGLGKPWEPDWSSFSEGTYPTITKCNGRIVKTSIYTHDCPLAFPTEEMRDAFYENFNDLIEDCKELL